MSAQQTQGMIASPVGSMQDIEKYKKYCKVASVDDKLFVLPTDVKFTDMSKMMPNTMRMPSEIPAVPSGMTQEQMKMMQQQMIQKPQSTP
jgi:hypothetical protein